MPPRRWKESAGILLIVVLSCNIQWLRKKQPVIPVFLKHANIFFLYAPKMKNTSHFHLHVYVKRLLHFPRKHVHRNSITPYKSHPSVI
ncbi:hypothetical protein FKM82_014502 [Ascaphus truei]